MLLFDCERHFAVIFAKRSEERRKAREEKIKPPRPRNDMLMKMERRLEQRRAERQKLEKELQIGQEAGNSRQFSANMVTFNSFKYQYYYACTITSQYINSSE